MTTQTPSPNVNGAAPNAPATLPINPSHEQFLRLVVPAALASQATHGIPAAVIVAQAILESNWGTSRLFKDAGNVFGIKDRPGPEGSWVGTTKECREMLCADTRAAFERYPSLQASFTAHARLLKRPRYQPVLDAARAGDIDGCCDELHLCGYATDPAYAAKLKNIIKRYGLKDIDRLLAWAEQGLESPRHESVAVATKGENA